VLGLVVGYSGEALSDVHRVADLVVTRLASKHLEYVRTPASIAKTMRTQRICRAWGHSFSRGFARVILDHVRDNLDQAPSSLIFLFFFLNICLRGELKRTKTGAERGELVTLLDEPYLVFLFFYILKTPEK
jgi:hypothetical protein